MNRVLTITTNPAIDMATTVTQVIAGPKLRCKAPRWDPGGGGVNVARAIRKLGGDALALVAVGGALGEKLLSLLSVEGVDVQAVRVSAESRISFAVTDKTSNSQYRLGVHILRLDRADAEVAAGRSLDRIDESCQFAQSLVDRGVAEIVVMGRGADGSLLVSKDTHIHAWSPRVEVRSKIGAGDTFVGAFSLALSRNEPLPTAIKRGVAGAAATVQTEGTALCDRQEVEYLFTQCQCIEI